MHKDENNAIRYLMKEMDPSEEMEFEKQMREDEDLLIEVESLRATNRKLSALSPKNPPIHVTQSIADEVKQIQADRRKKSFNITYFLKRGVAAAILVAGLTGGFYYYSSSSLENSPNSVSKTTEMNDKVEPWVDRNEILRFQDALQPVQNQDVQGEMNRSYEKLQLVNDPSGKTSAGGIMLTGSSN